MKEFDRNHIPSLIKIGKEYVVITFSVFLIVIGSHFFKFPINFTFGGITGLSVILAKISSTSPSTVNMVLNFMLLVLGFIFLGKRFGIKTVYGTLVLSIGLSSLDLLYPMKSPLTDEPILELMFAILLPSFGSALLFFTGASGGGTDIIAMILKKHFNCNIGIALLLSDVFITIMTIFVFDMKTSLFSFLGMVTKSLLVDNIIEGFNVCKSFQVVCSNPQPICDFIIGELKRTATICEGKGAYTNQNKYVVITALKRPQAILLSRYVKAKEPTAFITVTNTSEIIGNGFINYI